MGGKIPILQIDVSFDIVIFPGGVPLLGDVHLKNVVFLERIYRENDKLWADRIELLSKQQGININFVVFEKKTHIDHHLKTLFSFSYGARSNISLGA